VLTEPPDLDRASLAALLEARWGVTGARLEYLPLGFGSHHWDTVDALGRHWFVTVDDLEASWRLGRHADGNVAALRRAFGTAAALRDDARLEFVLAPLADAEERIVNRAGRRYAVTVAPFLGGRSEKWGPWVTEEERRGMATLLGRLHAATGAVSPDLPGREDFSLQSRAILEAALSDLDRTWDTGPFGEPTRALLAPRAADVRRRLAAYDTLAARVLRRPGWVITHGEPHRANVIRDGAGAAHVVDWDTTLLAPRERDLWMVLDDRRAGWHEYLSALGADVELDTDALELYREWWAISDVANFVAGFRRPHGRTDQTSAEFDILTENLRPT